MTFEGFLVTVAIHGAHPRLPDYPLLPDDLLVREEPGTWMKESPGLAVSGFVLTREQEQSLKPVDFRRRGLLYIKGDGA